MTDINYLSDFKVGIKGIDLYVPFKLTFYTNRSKYVVSHVDGKYINCRVLEDGTILAIFDNHGLEPGQLQVHIEMFLTDEDFKSGICHDHDDRFTDVILTNGKSDNINPDIIIYPNYQKGDKGEDMTWDKMTDENKQEIYDKFKEYVTLEDININNI